MRTLATAFSALLFLPLAASATSVAPEFWAETRRSSIVAVGTARRQGDQITFSVSKLLKGEPGTTTLTFPRRERVRSTFGPDEPVYFSGPPEGFETGQSCLVFLNSTGDGAARRLSLLSAFLERAEFVENVQDVMRLDDLPDEAAKCRLLVDFVIEGGPSQFYARDELDQNYDKEEYLDLFEEIAEDPNSRSWFVQLISHIEGRKALARLMQVLETGPEDMQLIAVAALSQRDKANEEVTRALVPFLDHKDPLIRAQTIVALDERGERSEFARIAAALADPDASVRGAAANWPWYDERIQTPETIAQLRKLSGDESEWVRFCAGNALIHAGDALSFYSLWWQSLVDSEYVRRSLPLDVLVERRPVATFLLLIWPTALAYVAAVRSRRRRKVRLAALPLGAILLGFAIGAAAGYCLGEYRTTNPLIHAVFLMPAITVPLCLLGNAVLATVRPRAKQSGIADADAVPQS